MKTYKERTHDILWRAEELKTKRRKIKFASVAAACMSVLIALNLILFLPYSTAYPSLSAYKDSEYYSLMQTLNKLTYTPSPYKNNFDAWFGDLLDGMKGAAEDDDNLTSDPAAGENYEEVTNNQTEGVIEGDLFKRTDKTVFYLNTSDRDHFTLQCYDVAGMDTALCGEFTIPAGGEKDSFTSPESAEMYLNEDGTRVTVFTPVRLSEKGARYTAVIGLDVSDPANVRELGRQYLSGEYVTSRSMDGGFLLINQFNVRQNPDFSDEAQFLPQYGDIDDLQSVAMQDIVCPEDARTARYTVLCRIDGASYEIEHSCAFLSFAQEVYVSAENAYVTRSYSGTSENVRNTKTENRRNGLADGALAMSETRTEICRVDLANGALSVAGKYDVSGSVKDQYSMDEKDGTLRVATTLSRQGVTNAGVYVFSVKDFTLLGKLENFAPDGEEVTAARFDGDTAYICTAYVLQFTDPVYAIDLSDPSNITAKDTGTIDGYSFTLFPFYQGSLLGIGYGNTRDTLKAEVYLETQDGVVSDGKYELSPCIFSDLFKAHLIDAGRGLIGLHVYDYDSETQSYYLLLRYDGYEIDEACRIPVEGDPDKTRACIIGDLLYVFTTDGYAVSVL